MSLGYSSWAERLDPPAQGKDEVAAGGLLSCSEAAGPAQELLGRKKCLKIAPPREKEDGGNKAFITDAQSVPTPSQTLRAEVVLAHVAL